MKKTILVDIKAWLAVLVAFPVITVADSWQQKCLMSAMTTLLIIAVYYPHKWLINKYLNQKKRPQYFVGLIILILFSAAVLSPFLKQFTNPEKNFIANLVAVIILIFFSTAISYAYKGILLQIQYEKTKRQQVEAELKLLQSQVNPHFLFNTLNNIYAQNLTHQDEANSMIMQLADLMRYQIESSKKNEVEIEDEIEFLENYIALEKKRLTEKTIITFEVENDDNLSFKIPPMLFIPFVENAFKHGINTEGGSDLYFYLGIEAQKLVFKAENPLPERKKGVKSTQTGLVNIQKRLDLLFPNKHQLDIIKGENLYKTQLTITF